MTRVLLSVCLALVVGCAEKSDGGGSTGPTANQQPQPRGSIPPQELQEGAETEVNVASYFSDPDGDQLSYSAISQRTSIVSVGASGSVVTIRGEGVGSVTVVVTATDPAGLNATQNLDVTVTERPVGVCDRTAQVRDAVVNELDGVTDCALVTRSQLAEIDSLDVSDAGLSSLQENDFQLLPGLIVLRLGANQLSQLPRNVFSNLGSLAVLDLSSNRLQALSAGTFSGLSSLRDLEFHDNRISRLEDGAFDGLRSLRALGLDANQLSELPQTVFSDLSDLESLDLWGNRLQDLPADIFAGLSSLRALALHTNQLSELPQTVFSNLTNLESLGLSNNRLRELPVGVFAGLSDLKELQLDANQLQVLPRGVFAGLSELRRLALEGNPGSPFGLTLRFERTDAASLRAPSPATVRLVLPEGAPFAFNVPLRPLNGTVSESSLPFAKGDTVSSRDFIVRQVRSGLVTDITTPSLPEIPDAISGIQLVPPDTLRLFLPPGGRASGIYGLVTVDGRGLEVEVSLFEHYSSYIRSRTTRADGQYSFAGLASGDYTVSIAVDTAAYVFDVTSQDVTVGYEETLIVNFRGRARTYDRDILEALYHATDGPNWIDSTNWLTDAPLGDWYGVETDRSGKVIRLDLSGQWDSQTSDYIRHGLRGELPVELANLSSLEWLDLGANQLSGPIPSELGGLSNLKSLSLVDNNQLSGPIPSELGGLSNLEVLYLGGNQLSGAIPSELGGLSNLKMLYLSWSQLSGAIPSELGGLSNLEVLYLGGNQLSGAIPSELGGLSNLVDLNLQYNRLSGAIPSELGGLSNLKGLTLDTNRLSGAIPPELGGLSNLEGLWLHSNQLSGALPLSLSSLSALVSFQYYNTNLCVPLNGAFRAWLNAISNHEGTGVDCAASQATMSLAVEPAHLASVQAGRP